MICKYINTQTKQSNVKQTFYKNEKNSLLLVCWQSREDISGRRCSLRKFEMLESQFICARQYLTVKIATTLLNNRTNGKKLPLGPGQATLHHGSILIQSVGRE